MNAPDPKWLDFMKIFFGFMLLVLLTALAAVIALGKVEQASSYGLQDILGGLLVLAGGYSHWAFSGNGKVEKGDSVPPPQ